MSNVEITALGWVRAKHSCLRGYGDTLPPRLQTHRKLDYCGFFYHANSQRPAHVSSVCVLVYQSRCTSHSTSRRTHPKLRPLQVGHPHIPYVLTLYGQYFNGISFGAVWATSIALGYVILTKLVTPARTALSQLAGQCLVRAFRATLAMISTC